MTNEFVLEAITREFPDSVISHSEPYDLLTLEIKKDDIKKVIHYLRDSSLEINFLTDICGIHYPENPAKEIGIFHEVGSISAGKKADFVLLDKDLNIVSIIQKGQVK